MSSRRSTYAAFAVAVVVLVLLGARVGEAAAAGLPAHGVPYPTWCNADSRSGLFGLAPGKAVINSGYPTADPIPGVNTSLISVDDSGRYGATVGSQEIDFRIWAAWWDGRSWQYRAGNWMRKRDWDLVWQVQGPDGRWYYTTPGINPVPQPGDGDIAESRVIVDAGRTYWVAYEYYWGAVSGSTFGGADDFQWYTQQAC